MILEKKVTKITKKETYTTKDGRTLYPFELVFDDNSVGCIFKASENSGIELNQTIKFTQTDKGTVKLYREGYSNNFSSNNNYTKEEKTKIFDAKDRRISKLAVLKAAVELVCSDKIDIADVQVYAENMLNWVYDKQGTKGLEFADDKVPF